MGQAERTSTLVLALPDREQGGANTQKRRYLEVTRSLLDEARSFYLAFFLAHPTKLTERVQVISKKTGEVRQAPISADKLLTWAQYQTVATREHPHPHPDWNLSAITRPSTKAAARSHWMALTCARALCACASTLGTTGKG